MAVGLPLLLARHNAQLGARARTAEERERVGRHRLFGTSLHLAQRDHLTKEKAFTQQREEMAAARRELPWTELTERSLREGLEQTWRTLARLTDDQAERIRLVDLANQVRPRSLL